MSGLHGVFLTHVRHSQCSCSLLLGCKTEQTLVQRTVSGGEAVRSQPLGFPAPEGGDAQHFLWFRTLCHLCETLRAGLWEVPGTCCCYHGAKKWRIVIITGRNWGKSSGSEKFVWGAFGGTPASWDSPCTLLPAGSLLCSSWYGLLLFNLRGLLLVITSCRHWERFSPGLLGGVSLEKDGEGGGRKVLLWILQPFSANSCNYRLCVLSQWHIIQQKPFLIETLQEVQIPPLFGLTN